MQFAFLLLFATASGPVRSGRLAATYLRPAIRADESDAHVTGENVEVELALVVVIVDEAWQAIGQQPNL